MATLIQLTRFSNGQPIIINADHIVSFHTEDDHSDGAGTRTLIGTSTGYGFIKVCEDIYAIADQIDAASAAE